LDGKPLQAVLPPELPTKLPRRGTPIPLLLSPWVLTQLKDPPYRRALKPDYTSTHVHSFIHSCTHKCDTHTHTANYAVWGTYTCFPLLRVHTKSVHRSGTGTSVYLRYIRTRHRCSLGPPRLLHPSGPTCSHATIRHFSSRRTRHR
jgi:hypothetical protein